MVYLALHHQLASGANLVVLLWSVPSPFGPVSGRGRQSSHGGGAPGPAVSETLTRRGQRLAFRWRRRGRRGRRATHGRMG